MNTKQRHVILLVDDQPIIGETLRASLAGADDIEAHVCTNPSEAVERAVALKPTLILQDLVMPGVDGLMLLKFFRAHPDLCDIPLMVLSSREDPSTKERAFAQGAHDYVVKLPHSTELVARIRHHSSSYIALRERNLAFEELENARAELAEEVHRAGEYARRLLPSPLSGRLTTEYLFEPSLSLGGDMLGYHWLDADNLAFYVLDVAGHGVGAALHGVSVATFLRFQSRSTVLADPAATLSALNQAFPSSQHGGNYFTIWYGVLNTARSELSYAVAAHPGALLLSPDEEVTELGSEDTMIGVAPDATFASYKTPMPPGSTVLVFSDGAFEIENRSGEMWDTDDFRRELLASGPLTMFFSACKRVAGSDRLDDDCTVLRIKFN